jgi:hypothetical protein
VIGVSNSMSSPRPVLINSLYDTKSNRCGTCGRRFNTTEEGKKKKAQHLDWHFRTNQRMTDSIKRGQNRSWYVDERVCSFTSVSSRDTLVNIIYRTGSNHENSTMIAA